jgi:hypothetical protein
VSTPFNYFNYFTDIEEYFWKKRGAHMLISPLDWAILESWQKAGIPVEVVLKGIDRAFESYARSRRGASGRPLKSLAYCVDAVLEAAAEAREAAIGSAPDAAPARPAADSFAPEKLRDFFTRSRERLLRAASAAGLDPAISAACRDAAARLHDLETLLDAPGRLDLEDLERRLTVLEDKLFAQLTAAAPDELLLRLRRELDRSLAPYRSKMSADQLAQLEQRFLRKRLFEEFDLPRLSLFYLT